MRTLRNFAFLGLVATIFAVDRRELAAATPVDALVLDVDPRCGWMDLCADEESGLYCIAPWINPPQQSCDEACNAACRSGGHGSDGHAAENYGLNPIDCGASTWCECYCDFGGNR